jgi:hypothetical protein
VTNKIDDDLPTEVLIALAEGCGFRLAFDRAPGVDEWTLSSSIVAGPITVPLQHVGTRRSVCAFLIGYSSMRQKTSQILNDLERANQELVLRMRARLGD